MARDCVGGQCVCKAPCGWYNGGCVTLQTDRNNRGSCGNARNGTKTCQMGACK